MSVWCFSYDIFVGYFNNVRYWRSWQTYCSGIVIFTVVALQGIKQKS